MLDLALRFLQNVADKPEIKAWREHVTTCEACGLVEGGSLDYCDEGRRLAAAALGPTWRELVASALASAARATPRARPVHALDRRDARDTNNLKTVCGLVRKHGDPHAPLVGFLVSCPDCLAELRRWREGG